MNPVRVEPNVRSSVMQTNYMPQLQTINTANEIGTLPTTPPPNRQPMPQPAPILNPFTLDAGMAIVSMMNHHPLMTPSALPVAYYNPARGIARPVPFASFRSPIPTPGELAQQQQVLMIPGDEL